MRRTNVTLESVWPQLLEGIAILVNDVELAADKGLDSAAFMNLYTLVYNYCTTTRPVASRRPRGFAGANFVGEKLYTRLQSFLRDHLHEVEQAAESEMGENLLLYYQKHWSRFTQAMRYINHVFSYLNRHWIKREAEDGKKEGVYQVKILGLVVWRDVVFMRIKERLTRALLDVVERDRNGEQVNSSLIQSIIDGYVKLGLNKERPTEATLEIYHEHFETQFLEATEAYYGKESSLFISENTISDYLKKVQVRLEQELGERARTYLHPATEAPLTKAIDKVLIQAHIDAIQNEFEPMLKNHVTDDLHRMYKLLSRIAGGLDKLKTVCERFIREVGLDRMQSLSQGKVTPQSYCECLLQTWTRYAELVTSSFENDPGFTASLDKACRNFVNENAVSGLSDASSSKSPELLARYCDSLLKRGGDNHSEEEIDELLTQVLTVFKYISEKDVFLVFFSKMLAKRLINETSTSEDLESSMIGKLKSTCGFEYTSKLQRMFTDIGLSREVNQQFVQSQSEAAPVDFNVLVLATGSWPLSQPSSGFTMPPILAGIQERFDEFYLEAHTGRKLQWLPQHSKGELRAKYLSKGYTFQCSTYQMGVLLQFESQDSVSHEQLTIATQLKGSAMEHVLYSLVRTRVLAMSPAPAKVSDPEISHDATFKLNPKFKSKRLRVNINLKQRGSKQRETQTTNTEIVEARKLATQACIVRIMKARKSMKHALLITEVVNQMKDRFKVKVSLIKKSIDILIEKEYLERAEGQRDQYNYLA